MKAPEAFIIVEKGEPYDKGTSIPLSGKDEILLGRPWQDNRPVISFNSLYVSRRHAVITFRDNWFYITDLKSKHGTMVNDCPISPNQPWILRHGDLITLANDKAVLRLDNPAETGPDETVELTGPLPAAINSPHRPLVIDPARREVTVNGRLLNLVGKDIEMILLLYEHRNIAVSYEKIKSRIWPERVPDTVTNIPDVGNDEITSLIYRLRKRLGRFGNLISTVPRYGYMLNYEWER